MSRVLKVGVLVGAVAVAAAGTAVLARQVKAEGAGLLQKYHVALGDIPAPGTGTANPPQVVDKPAGATLNLPPGFAIDIFAEAGDFKNLRYIIEGDNGEIFAADSSANTITSISDTDGDGKADERHVFAEGLKRPWGMAITGGYFYVASTDSVVRWKYTPGSEARRGQARNGD